MNLADSLKRGDETVDRLTSKFRIIQKRRGHRAASDDMLLAWAAARACPGAVRVLDLGSGKGTVAMLLLQRLPACRVIALEVMELSHDLAVRNRQLNGLEDRWLPRLGDLRDPSTLEGEPAFDLITGAPPFMPMGSGVLPADSQRAAGRFELRGGVCEYAKAAAKHLAPQGRVVLLMDGLDSSRTRALQALAESHLFPHRILEVRPKPDRNPIYFCIEGGREQLPVCTESIFMRDGEGKSYSSAYEAIRRDMDCIPIEKQRVRENQSA
jgi:tRNA1(Val) A37 N6-methylase TrmN6